MKKTEVVIDFRDLIAEFIRKSYLIILLSVLMAVLLCGMKYFKDIENYELIKENQEQNVDMDDLSKEEKEQLTFFLEEYYAYKNFDEYYNNSIYLSCDPYNVSVMDITYEITVENENKLATVWHMYRDYICSGEMTMNISQKNEKYSASLLQEVIILYNNGEESKGILDIRVLAKDKKQLKYLTDLVNEQINLYSKELEGKMQMHSLSLLETHEINLYMPAIADTKSNVLNQLNGKKNEIEQLLINLSSEQKKILVEKIDDVEVEIPEEPEIIKPQIDIKYFVIGLLAGGLITSFGVFICYYFSPKIKTQKEVSSLYGINLIGGCTIGKENIFEKLANKLMFQEKMDYQKKDMDYIAQKIVVIAKGEKIKKIFLAGGINDFVQNEMCKISKLLLDEKIEVEFIGDILAEKKALEILAENDSVILINCIRKTEYSRIEEEIQLCNALNVRILGYIAFAE